MMKSPAFATLAMLALCPPLHLMAHVDPNHSCAVYELGIGGSPVCGKVLASSRFKVTVSTIGDPLAQVDLRSPRHRLDKGFTITAALTSNKPGDCNGDGSVSIGEVQKAINMFLGSIPPDCGVDCSGDGSVSIGEVQKVINAFLGIPSSC